MLLRLRLFKTDSGGEYINCAFKKFLQEKEVVHQRSCSYTPEQNGVVERKNKHILETARALPCGGEVLKVFWADTVQLSIYQINRMPSSVFKGISPFQKLHRQTPNYDVTRVFGYICFVLLPDRYRDKLSPKTIKCCFLSFANGQKDYKCYDHMLERGRGYLC